MKAMTKYMLNGFVNGAAQMTGIIGIGNGLTRAIQPDSNGKRHVASGIFQLLCGSAVVAATVVHRSVSEDVYENVFLDEAMEDDEDGKAHTTGPIDFVDMLRKDLGWPDDATSGCPCGQCHDAKDHSGETPET